jgi:hypothetical protein
VAQTPSGCARRVLDLCYLSDLIDRRSADSSVTGAAAALGTWVPIRAVSIRAIEGIDRQAEMSTSDSLPETVVARRVGATSETTSEDVDDRADLRQLAVNAG